MSKYLSGHYNNIRIESAHRLTHVYNVHHSVELLNIANRSRPRSNVYRYPGLL